jgi:excinuclease ABC subunit A
VTYIKAYDDIRNLFADQNISVQRGYKPKHFSFNVAGGRCERCEGEGTVTIEMQFMADVKVVCEECHGKKFKNEILEVKHHGKSIFDVLEMTIDEAIEFFSKTDQNKISKHLQTLLDVGLGYVKLGQSSSTLSGGEAQRIKLASFLLKGKDAEPTMFIFDEPTTGLHFHDVAKLLKAFDALLEKGHTILVIEHQMDVVRAADWLIDLGPEGGNRGGFLTYSGIPKGIEESTDSVTKNYLKDQKNI